MTAPHSTKSAAKKQTNREQLGCVPGLLDVVVVIGFSFIGLWLDLSFWSRLIILAIPVLIIISVRVFWKILTR